MITLSQIIKKTCTQYAEKIAVVDKRRELTYQQLKEEACQLASALLSRGFQKGDRIGILSANRVEHIVIDLAVAMTGLIKVPINIKLHPKEIQFILENAKANLVIGEISLLKTINFTGDRVTFENDYNSFLANTDSEYPDCSVIDTDSFAIMYTSGTTGRPKGAVLSHRAIIASAQSLIMACELGYEDTIGHVAPLTHGSNFLAQCALFFGLKQVIFDKFDPKFIADQLEKERVTTIFMVPTIVNLMIQEESFEPRKLRFLKSINMAGAPIASEKLQVALDKLGPIFAETYGLVEAPMAITIMPKHKLPHYLSSCGAVGPMVEMILRDEDGNEVHQGKVGEITCKGPLVMDKYWANEEATSNAIKDGWFYTGDLGWIDPFGHLHLIDRKNDVIISGGMNIYPREVEEALNLHKAVKEACVFGVENEKWGESVYAHVVLKNNMTVEESQLVSHCKEHMASYKKPAYIEIVPSLPKSPYGKILRRELKKSYEEGVKG
ncbi:class I adenylate-forming enzyme family protein [Shouchella lehensis]|uniref:Long-chain fatty acid--CoA ligase n=1 Tax=Shouchella lehensis TaxID=300825 RepID=A0A4Y7WPF1_9BACI|nr:AMP-binding protein [Shouchella lehensis]MBG9784613.1 long-chain fatty acid--CoA ligase [Shouchella lehensis]RQW20357.1 long-chain fatty acid--CoA ligase [Bacillus sp. C1-1]TES50370.1 long-chain fatty acid--CoA ligase [Shouchella lehensis]